MPLAIVTGASSGIGLGIARQLAGKKYDLLLVARGEAGLRKAAGELGNLGVRVETLAADLCSLDGVARVEAEISQRGTVDVLVNNAGVGTYGRFWEMPAASEEEQIMLNIRALMRLTRAVLPGMVARKRGAVINTASTAAFQPVPYFATYGATKAFVLSFTEAVAAELKGSGNAGVRVAAFCPGPVETGFQDRAGASKDSYGFLTWESVDAVARQAVALIDGGGPTRITGFASAFMAFTNRFTPRNWVTAVEEWMFRPKSAQGVSPAPTVKH